MTFSRPLLLLLLGGGLSYGTSLSVYKDNTLYSYTPNNNFIGFAQNITAKCKGTTIPISEMMVCPPEERLCNILTGLEVARSKELANSANMKVLGQLITISQPNTLDANAWIEAARLTGAEEARLMGVATTLKKEIAIRHNRFRKQAPREIALQSTQVCHEDIEVSIPYGVSFSTKYEANIVDDKEVEVTQYLSILNSSGIDIKVDSASFYYRLSKQYVHPMHFNPWIVSKYVLKPKRKYKKSMARSAPMKEMSMMDDEMSGAGTMVQSAPVASYEDAREYKIKNLTLPSSGDPLDVNVLSWKSALECEVKAYTYANTRAFHVCSFEPKYQIESNRWKIKSSDVVINENAAGEYRGGKYNLYTKVEEDVQIRRIPIVQKERETGIFGGTARKKDGFTLTLTNKSDKVKTLTIVERIPTSTTEEIKSKLLSIKSEKKVDYKTLKDGEIKMHITLVGNETKKIEILFEISYHKEVKVSY